MNTSNNDELKKISEFSNKDTATLLDLYNHNMMTYRYQSIQADPGAVQLRRRFESMSVRFFIKVLLKRGTYYPPKLLKGPQHLSLVLPPGGKIHIS